MSCTWSIWICFCSLWHCDYEINDMFSINLVYDSRLSLLDFLAFNFFFFTFLRVCVHVCVCTIILLFCSLLCFHHRLECHLSYISMLDFLLTSIICHWWHCVDVSHQSPHRKLISRIYAMILYFLIALKWEIQSKPLLV